MRTLELADPTPAQARELVRRLLGDQAYDVELATSELVTNAHTHGNGQVTFTLTHSNWQVRIETRNLTAGRETPETQAPQMLDEHGRGLSIVEALSRTWGWRQKDQQVIVWAEIDLD